jgi:hypothetical protein
MLLYYRLELKKMNEHLCYSPANTAAGVLLTCHHCAVKTTKVSSATVRVPGEKTEK